MDDIFAIADDEEIDKICHWLGVITAGAACTDEWMGGGAFLG